MQIQILLQMGTFPLKAIILVFTVYKATLKFLAVFCRLYTERYNSSSQSTRITWSAAKSKVSNFKFLFMVILLCDVSRHFLFMSFIFIINNTGERLNDMKTYLVKLSTTP